MTAAGQENRQLARLEFRSPELTQVEQWANERIDAFDPEGIFDRNEYIHAFITLHEVLEDARVEHLYVQKYPESAAAFAALAEQEIAYYQGENPVGPGSPRGSGGRARPTRSPPRLFGSPKTSPESPMAPSGSWAAGRPERRGRRSPMRADSVFRNESRPASSPT